MTLRELRKQHKLTQRELAQAVGISRSSINEIERGVLSPSFGVADRIASHFGLPVELIFPKFKRLSPYPKNTKISC
jgi:putative transcriptional regulator